MRYQTLVVVTALASATCGGAPAPSPAAKATPAATVSGAKPEIDIATITLSADAERRLGIETMAVAAQAVAQVRTVGGEAVVAPGRAVALAAPVAGTLVRPVGAGAETGSGPVAAGTPIFTIVPMAAADRDMLVAAQRETSDAEARLTLADQRLKRLEALLKEGSVSARVVEEAKADHAMATAAATAARQRMATASRLPLGTRDELTITAPFDGEIIAIHAVAGQTVPAGTPIAELARVDALWVRVPLFAGDVDTMDVTKGARVAALGNEASGPWYQAPRVTGPPSADLGASSVDLYFDLGRAGSRVRPHERVSVQLTLKAPTSAGNAITIPESAMLRDLQGGTWVYEVRAPHVFARRRVETGDPTPSGVVVTRGLTEGVRIVTVGAAELYGTEFYVSK